MVLRYERTGKLREVVEFRRDGWPICPCCDEDELAAIAAIPVTSPNQIDLCYRCGPITVLEPLPEPKPEAPAPKQEGLF